MKPVQPLVGSGDRFRVLAMPQVVSWTTIPIPERLDDTMHGVDAHRDSTFPLNQRLQLADAPDRDRQAVIGRP